MCRPGGNRRQSHPRRIPGFLTVPQLIETLNLERSWIYDRIHNGTIQVTLDAGRKLYLFVIEGNVDVNGVPHAAGDQARITEVPDLKLKANENAEVILLDLP